MRFVILSACPLAGPSCCPGEAMPGCAMRRCRSAKYASGTSASPAACCRDGGPCSGSVGGATPQPPEPSSPCCCSDCWPHWGTGAGARPGSSMNCSDMPPGAADRLPARLPLISRGSSAYAAGSGGGRCCCWTRASACSGQLSSIACPRNDQDQAPSIHHAACACLLLSSTSIN
jgi:hypothetical protein